MARASKASRKLGESCKGLRAATLAPPCPAPVAEDRDGAGARVEQPATSSAALASRQWRRENPEAWKLGMEGIVRIMCKARGIENQELPALVNTSFDRH